MKLQLFSIGQGQLLLLSAAARADIDVACWHFSDVAARADDVESLG
jgi:hypothetical protein